MAKSIRDRLPGKVDLKLVQAKCSLDLVTRTQEQMKQDEITWQELLEASMHAYLDESKQTTKPQSSAK